MLTNVTKIKNNIKLDKSYLNYYNIINKRFQYKFSYLDDWLLKNSNLLLKEIKTINESIRYKNMKEEQ